MTYRIKLLAAIQRYSCSSKPLVAFLVVWRPTRQLGAVAAICVFFGIAGCHEQAAMPLVEETSFESEPVLSPIASRLRARKSASHREEGGDRLVAASVLGLNYTSYYIAGFSITDAQGHSGGGLSIYPSKGGKKPVGGDAERCCLMISEMWTAGTTVTVSWERNTRPNDHESLAADQWLTAVAKVPPHGKDTYGFWVYFLDGDRIKVLVGDGTDHGKPAANDPYIAQGLPDEKLNGARHR